MNTVFLLAAYDAAYLTANGNYWTWRSHLIPPEICERAYYSLREAWGAESAHRLDRSNSAGCASIDDQWCCWYRLLDGGRDLRGRPGRMIILFAFARREELAEGIGSDVLESIQIEELVRTAQSRCPYPAPVSLEIISNVKFASNDEALVAEVKREGTIELRGQTAIGRSASICARLPAGSRFHLMFEIGDLSKVCRLNVEVPPVGSQTALQPSDTPIPNENRPDKKTHEDKPRPQFKPQKKQWWLLAALLVVGIAGMLGSRLRLGTKPALPDTDHFLERITAEFNGNTPLPQDPDRRQEFIHTWAFEAEKRINDFRQDFEYHKEDGSTKSLKSLLKKWEKKRGTVMPIKGESDNESDLKQLKKYLELHDKIKQLVEKQDAVNTEWKEMSDWVGR